MHATLTPLPGAEAALIGLAALVVVMIPFLWPLADHFDTMAHEGAHAIVISAVGFTLLGVTLDQEAGGVTSYLAAPGTAGRRALAAFVGYLGPSAFGLCGARLIETGHVVSVLRIAAVLLVLLFFLIRRSFGVASVPAAIALLAVIMRYAYDGLEEVIAYGMTWLLLSGARTAVAHRAGAGDAGTLSAITRLPRQFWALLWIAGTLLAVVIGGKWLVLRS